MSRQRMTWGGDGRPAPTRRASAHPAVPWEGETHPAAYPDPEADAYENGDPSSWAEDPHPPPYRTSLAPAVPYDDGGYRHPATQPGAPARNASMNVRAAAERKAAKCVRIAAAILGPKVAAAAERGDKVAESMIEDQAFDLMDLSDARLAATMLRFEASTEDDDTLLRKMLAAEGDVDAEDEDEAPAKASKKADDRLLAEIRSLKAEIRGIKAGRRVADTDFQMQGGDEDALLAEMMHEEKMGGYGHGHMAEDDALLAEMMHEEKMGGYGHMGGDDDALLAEMMHEEKMGGRHMGGRHMGGEEEALLAEMLHEEKVGGYGHMAEDDETESMLAEMMDEAAAPAPMASKAPVMAEDDEPVMGGFEDPMAMGEGEEMGADEEAILASLFASRAAADESDADAEDEEAPAKASKKAEDEEIEEEEEDEEVEASKKAALRPQPRKASVGPKTLGGLTRTASAGGDLGDLARLWTSAPDVSKVFGN